MLARSGRLIIDDRPKPKRVLAQATHSQEPSRCETDCDDPLGEKGLAGYRPRWPDLLAKRDTAIERGPVGEAAVEEGAEPQASSGRSVGHDLRHQCVSLLIAGGKDPLYISKRVGRSDPGFTLRQYGHLFEMIKRTPVEWIDDRVWPTGCDASVTLTAVTRRQDTGGHVAIQTAESDEIADGVL